jgi:hypothetical protein
VKTITITFTWPDGTQAIGTRQEQVIDDVVKTTWGGDPDRIASMPVFVRDTEWFSFRDGSARRDEAAAFAAGANARLEVTDTGDWDFTPDDLTDPNAPAEPEAP